MLIIAKNAGNLQNHMLQLPQSIIFLIFYACYIVSYSKTQVKRNLNAFKSILTKAESAIVGLCNKEKGISGLILQKRVDNFYGQAI